MNFGFITTSRADFGLYIPLLQRIKEAKNHEYFIFAGGMHTSERFGLSYRLIEKEYGFKVSEKKVTLLNDDSKYGVSASMGITMQRFSEVWKKYEGKLDVVFVLGDRFEMFAAAASIVPFNIPLAHLHGGETTLGAIDNKFRHAITCMADIHFTSHDIHAKRVMEITGSEKNVYNVGALGIDNILNANHYPSDDFNKKFGFDISKPFILVTYHPETIELKNKEKINTLIRALKEIPYKVLCTLPNADTEGMIIRNAFLDYEKKHPEKIKCLENLGQQGYLTAMKHCVFMMGNTSSGIIEAAGFNKPVVNIGNRQKGRICGANVIHAENKFSDILKRVKAARALAGKKFADPYGDGKSAERILTVLKGACLLR